MYVRTYVHVYVYTYIHIYSHILCHAFWKRSKNSYFPTSFLFGGRKRQFCQPYLLFLIEPSNWGIAEAPYSKQPPVFVPLQTSLSVCKAVCVSPEKLIKGSRHWIYITQSRGLTGERNSSINHADCLWLTGEGGGRKSIKEGQWVPLASCTKSLLPPPSLPFFLCLSGSSWPEG